MTDAGVGGSGGGGSSPYKVKYGHDIFCTGRRVDTGGGNEGEFGVANQFYSCLRRKVLEPAAELLEPRSEKKYMAAVERAAQDLFGVICLVEKRKFVQASTNKPMQDKDVIEMLKVELKGVRNALKAEMKHNKKLEALQRNQEHLQYLQQQEQRRRDEERSQRDRGGFEREQQEKRRHQNQSRRQQPSNGTSPGGSSGGGRWCANPVSPSPAYAFGGDHQVWGSMGQRRRGSDRRSPFHRSEDHAAFAPAAAYNSDCDDGRGAAKPDKFTQARQQMAEIQKRRQQRGEGKEPEERARRGNWGPNRGGSNGAGAPSSSSFHGDIPRKRSATGDDKSKGNKSGQAPSNKKETIGEKHRFKKLVSATEASSFPPKGKPTWEPPPGRTHAPVNLPPPTSPGREAAQGRAVSYMENESSGRNAIGNESQLAPPGKSATSPVAPSEIPEASAFTAAADTSNEEEMAGEFDMDDADSLSTVNATSDEAKSQPACIASSEGDLEFSSVTSPFNKKRSLKVSRKRAAFAASTAKERGSKRTLDEIDGADDNNAILSEMKQDTLKPKKSRTGAVLDGEIGIGLEKVAKTKSREGHSNDTDPTSSTKYCDNSVESIAEEVVTDPVNVPLSSIVGFDGIVTIGPMEQDEYEELDNIVLTAMKGRSRLCSKRLPPCEFFLIFLLGSVFTFNELHSVMHLPNTTLHLFVYVTCAFVTCRASSSGYRCRKQEVSGRVLEGKLQHW
jgi:hypothetical protein